MAGRRAPPLRPAPSGVAGLRQAIGAALEDGLAPGAMLLRLTHRDLALLKRSAEVELHEIRFKDGAMSFLDVPVAAERAGASHLDRCQANSPAAAALAD